jgi:hypothetical protein
MSQISRKGPLRYLIGVNIDPWAALEIRAMSGDAGLGSHMSGKSHARVPERTNGCAAAFKSDGRIVEKLGDMRWGFTNHIAIFDAFIPQRSELIQVVLWRGIPKKRGHQKT